MSQASSAAQSAGRTGWPPGNVLFSGVRNATPDSDALASSDDENDQLQPMHALPQQPSQRYGRRASWLSDSQPMPRKVSFTASSGSQPPTPSSDQASWISAPTANRPSTSGAAFPWGTNIWSQEGKKDPPRRLTELVSPSSPIGNIGRRASGVQPRPSFSDDGRKPSEPPFPFSIPLYPTPKTYRSMSYSVGQKDEEEDAAQEGAPVTWNGPSATYGNLPGQYGLASRDISRPSNEYLYGAHGLGQLQEDEGEGWGGIPGQSRPINASDAVTNSLVESLGGLQLNNAYYQGSADGHSGKPNVGKRGQWQTQLGFGAPLEGSQSRRHSFAAGEVSGLQDGQGFPGYAGSRNVTTAQNDPSQQFPLNPQSNPYSNNNNFIFDSLEGRHVPAEMEPLPIPTQRTTDRNYFVVHFKYQRADVYVLPPNTGLELKVGDPVIVEADRGFDLGAVYYSYLSLEHAIKMKEELAKQHHQYLLGLSKANMAKVERGLPGVPAEGSAFDRSSYNRHASNLNTGVTVTPGQNDRIEGKTIRTKQIRCKARPHEIWLLTDKEGNEEKAKRICKQKVAEHQLPMEILEAEFQLDFKKLTFYYYADTYIDFTNLVGDLFKIWKTRIWMSAVNPASLHTPPNPHLSLGPGAVPQAQQPSTYRPLGNFRGYPQGARYT
ncbi:MAG: hypothetical protein M1820_005944 [Bogoriella megaspora]|nr:MAG: hypothetical protein M1820_005944 [Bogoriella megaspora]